MAGGSKTKAGRLAEAATPVAVASLRGPVAGGGALVAELVKHGVGRWEGSAKERELHRLVSDGITRWAQKEQVQGVELGLELAGEVIARHGMDAADIARL